MKTKLFVWLSVGLLLLVGGPAFARGGRTVGGGGGSGYHSSGSSRGGGYTSGRSFAGRGYSAGGGGSYRSRSFAFGGSSYRSGGYGGYGGYGNHYRYYNNGWLIVDPSAFYPYYGDYPDYGPDETAAAPAVDNGAPVSVQVQQALARQGYYRGPIDGIVGPGTQAAIAAYQRDNGLRATGTINGRLMYALDLD